MKVRILFVNGELGTYHVRVKGNGKVTVLLECGMMHTLHQWKYLQEELSKYAKVITYDRLGYGKSGIWTTLEIFACLQVRCLIVRHEKNIRFRVLWAVE